MDLPQVGSCFFGIVSLEVGSIIIGIICLLISPGLGYYAFKLGDIWWNIQMVFTIACLIASILLLLGILVKFPVFIQIFVIVWLIDLFYVVVLMVATVILNSHDAVNAIISGLIYILIVGYFIIVVNSYHVSVKGKSALSV